MARQGQGWQWPGGGNARGTGAARGGASRASAGSGASPAARRRAPARRSARAGARVGRYQSQAQGRLRRFRQGSILAVALTAWLLMILGVPALEAEPGSAAADEATDVRAAGAAGTTASPAAGAVAQEPTPDAQDPATPPPTDTAADAGPIVPRDTAVDLGRSAEEAAGTVREIVVGLAGLLPALLVAIGILLAAALLTAVVRPLLRRALGSWTRADAMSALAGIVIWLVAISAALSVIVGDPRTLLGSVGLIGLALSWALQQPIESFTAWLLNSFRGYYRVGDRIEVGDVFGDVYRIDFLTTTVWEAGGPDKPVQGAQPTGALVTFPNSEVLRANVVNYTRDFPYVWAEIDVQLTNESDLEYSLAVLERTADAVVGESMAEPIHTYRSMLERVSLDFDIADRPQVFFSQADSWTNATIRYLVDARRRRITASRLLMAVASEMAKAEHRGRMDPAYPTARLSIVPPDATTGA